MMDEDLLIAIAVWLCVSFVLWLLITVGIEEWQWRQREKKNKTMNNDVEKLPTQKSQFKEFMGENISLYEKRDMLMNVGFTREQAIMIVMLITNQTGRYVTTNNQVREVNEMLTFGKDGGVSNG